ncbi:MAG: MerR family transcriptional regulator, partial [Streptomycetaceae bacterium]|nr:MerR family transcriptional regulator [Streptomycetaceae bacterium]
MRIAELSRATGVPVPTIKYYVREGLLPPGELTSRTQAQYGDAHVRRLKLVRALVEVGGVSVAAARKAVEAIDAEGRTLHSKIGAAHYLLSNPSPLAVGAADREHAESQARALIDELGWRVHAKNPAAELLVQALAALHWLGHETFAD